MRSGRESSPHTSLPQGSSPWSLATRLTVWYALSAFLLIAFSTGFLYWGLLNSLREEDDRFLFERIQILRRLVQDEHASSRELTWEVESEWQTLQSPLSYARILDPKGQSLVESRGMMGRLSPEMFPAPIDPDEGLANGAEVRTPFETTFRVMAARVAVEHSDDDFRTIQVALDITREHEILAGYRLRLFFVLGLSFLLCIVTGHYVVRRGIHPVQSMAESTAQIRSSTLHERLNPAGLPAELATLAVTFNEMLERLEQSFARLSRFSADIAHELRTPLNNLRGETEVALNRARSNTDYREILLSNLEEYSKLSAIIDRLLFLARAEDPEIQIQTETVDLRKELDAVKEFYEPLAEERRISLELQRDLQMLAEVDRTLLQRALGNLIDNAISHTPAEGKILISAYREDGAITIEVSDTGEGIPTEHLPHIFDRFYRVDGSRSKASGGVGLGLSIVKSIAELHRGSVRLSSEPNRGTRVILSFPQITKS